MNEPFDDNQLQKLIDGELDQKAVSKLLKSVDMAPEGWREIAVAFVEDSLWRRSFGNLNQAGGVAAKPAPLPATENRPSATPLPAGPSAAQAKPRGSLASLPSWLAMAAGLLVAVGFGYFAGSSGQAGSSSGDAGTIATQQAPANHESDAQPQSDITLVSLEPEYELELPAQHGVSGNSIPLYSSQAFERLAPSSRSGFSGPAISDRQRDQMRRSGYQIHQNVDYLSGRLKDGRSFVVPVRTINLSSGQ